jgi:hypothetical protein
MPGKLAAAAAAAEAKAMARPNLQGRHAAVTAWGQIKHNVCQANLLQAVLLHAVLLQAVP